AAQARARAARAAAKKAAARRAAARKAAARPKPRAKPRSQPKPRPKPSQVKRAVKKVAKEVREEAKETVKEEVQAQACEVNSFVPGTKVLMADGSAKPIEKVKAGEKVVATDPRTGKTTVRTATATIVGKGSKDLVRITLTVHDGSTADAEATTVTATAGHPFWVPSLREWVDAGELKPGQWLQTSSGAWIQIGAVEAWTAKKATVHNLTVTDVHTYYVLVGAAPVLVHNCNPAFTDDPYNPKTVGDRIKASESDRIPDEVHDTVLQIEQGRIGQRISNGRWDAYELRTGRRGTPRAYRRWANATIYTGTGSRTTLTRVLVRPDGEVGYTLGHNYNQVFAYPWARLPRAYTGRSGPVG
ncbi:polymorphic toxin-type HINT domain-containing protein, partial [Streptomyces sp. NY05-11A]